MDAGDGTQIEEYKNWIVSEQKRLWAWFSDAIQHSLNGVWSIRSEFLASCIIENAKLVGAVGPESVGWDMVAGGVYEALLDACGIPHPEVDVKDTAWDSIKEYFSDYPEHSVSALQERYKPTIDEINKATDLGDLGDPDD